MRISCADGRLLLHNLCFLTKYAVPHISVLNSYKHPLINYLSLSALASIEANLYMNLTLPVCPSAIAEYV